MHFIKNNVIYYVYTTINYMLKLYYIINVYKHFT